MIFIESGLLYTLFVVVSFQEANLEYAASLATLYLETGRGRSIDSSTPKNGPWGLVYEGVTEPDRIFIGGSRFNVSLQSSVAVASDIFRVLLPL
ncbi:hypothetical protein C8R44DRAFT_777205 [Mycena epipterygia]|nr:hypothetical protein C8R44DRAFT_777205 [Mycena epipterygia]